MVTMSELLMSELLYRYSAGIGPDEPLGFCDWGFGHYWHDGMTKGAARCPEHDGLPDSEGGMCEF